MIDYNFHSLSSNDLEVLTRDLLQKHLNIYLDNFKSGRDGGIDLRSSKTKDKTLIVQCKHYINTPYNTLISELKNEVKKLYTLKPSRYILVTTQGLTPMNKEEIKKIFEPFICSTEDIYSRENLNNLLGLYPEIEKRHYKLWLSSQNIMDKIMHNEIFNRTEITVETIKRKMKLYVQNESYFKSREVLSEMNCCIIAGAPGIGKTTLAEMLLIEYLSNDYEIYKLSNVDEAFKVYQSQKKQVFYYDDFLGQTNLNVKLKNQEDENILQLISMAKRNPNTKFILTTREYILNQAKTTYEKLANFEFDTFKHVIQLSNYTKTDKAKILYNHIYFSELPKELSNELLENKNYKKIIDHKNYNPRIIEKMTIELFNKDKVEPSLFFSEFISNLDNPMRIWEHAFTNQLSSVARNVLLVMASLPDPVTLDDLLIALKAFEETCNEKSTMIDFNRALKELQDSFIDINRIDTKNFITYNNPSIKDYVEHYLSNNLHEFTYLCRSSIFFDQCVSIRNIRIKDQITKPLFMSCIQDFLISLERNFSSKSITFSFREKLIKEEVSLFERFSYVKSLSITIPGDEFVKTLMRVEKKLYDDVSSSKNDKHNFILFLNDLKNNSYKNFISQQEWVRRFKKILFSDLTDLHSYEILTDLQIAYPSEFSQEETDSLKNLFLNFHENDVFNFLDAVAYEEELNEYTQILVTLATYFDLDIDDILEEIDSKRQEIYVPDYEPDYDDYDDDWRFDRDSKDSEVDDQIDILFDGLRE